MSGIKHFCSRLVGRPFQLWTDHKPLNFALHRVSTPTSGRQQRHLAFISEYTNQLVHLPGTANVVADALSRPAAAAAAGAEWVCAAIADRSPLDLKDMALRQILCPQVQALRSSPGLRIITQKVGDLDLISDSSICIYICVQKYTSVYSLPLPNSFLTVIRSFHTVFVASGWCRCRRTAVRGLGSGGPLPAKPPWASY